MTFLSTINITSTAYEPKTISSCSKGSPGTSWFIAPSHLAIYDDIWVYIAAYKITIEVYAWQRTYKDSELGPAAHQVSVATQRISSPRKILTAETAGHNGRCGRCGPSLRGAGEKWR